MIIMDRIFCVLGGKGETRAERFNYTEMVTDLIIRISVTLATFTAKKENSGFYLDLTFFCYLE